MLVRVRAICVRLRVLFAAPGPVLSPLLKNVTPRDIQSTKCHAANTFGKTVIQAMAL